MKRHHLWGTVTGRHHVGPVLNTQFQHLGVQRVRQQTKEYEANFKNEESGIMLRRIPSVTFMIYV